MWVKYITNIKTEHIRLFLNLSTHASNSWVHRQGECACQEVDRKILVGSILLISKAQRRVTYTELIDIQGGPKVGIYYTIYYILYTYFWHTLCLKSCFMVSVFICFESLM